MFSRPPSNHVCLTAQANSTVEHLAVLARQCEAEGLATCWIDLGEPGVAEAVRRYSGREPVGVGDPRALQKHFRTHRPVAVWLHTPYPEHYPEWFWPIAQRWPLSYVPYASGFPTGGWEEGQFGLKTFKRCTWLLATHEGIRAGYLRNGIQADRVVLTGGPMAYEVRHSSATPAERSDLLWAPHWIEDYFGQGSFSTWRWTAPVILDHAKRHPELRITVRPHPFLETAIDATPDNPDAIRYRELLALPNVHRSSGTVIDDVLGSDALISEGMSLNAYFATTGRPLGMTRGSIADFPEEWEQLLGVCDALATPEEAAAWLEALPQARPSPERRDFMLTKLPTFDRSPIAIWNEHRLAAGTGARRARG